ncbi:NACHT domain-containing protein [Streptomyces sp. NPDC046862]|uniref:NACHT domain-containing protein n=1 Tax=Streptomyces sp. NPDC046862 TaxID=3154603 RepID=UPI003452E2D4
MHPELERVAAVFGDRQGSGYLLTERLVLTCGHVMGNDWEPTAIAPNGTGMQTCDVVWRRGDAALLFARHSLVGERSLGVDPEWAQIDGLQVWPGARAVGYPRVQRDGANLDSHQAVGTFNPGTGALSEGALLENLERPIGGSPWAGMSGAAVFVEGLLVGVVRADPTVWRHGRLEIVPVANLMTDNYFVLNCREAGHDVHLRSLTFVGQGAATAFDNRLRRYVSLQADRVRVTGLFDDDFYWSLQRSYVDLNLAVRDDAAQSTTTPGERASASLTSRHRVLLVGAAGSGKTTFLQRLALAAARRELPPHLAELNECLPLLLQLRELLKRGDLPDPRGFLAAVAKPLVTHPDAVGWVDRQLEAGRVLLMIDGLDEVPRSDRDRARKWLSDLIDAYPQNRFIVTSRPAAVPRGWLRQHGFAELETQPMSAADISRLVEGWFDAMSEAHDHELVNWARAAVVQQLRDNPDLAELATSPLMCTLICALSLRGSHRVPRSRAELYGTALKVFLELRDAIRGIDVRGPRLPAHVQSQLLGRFAFWLALNGEVELERERAVKLVQAELRSLRLADVNDPKLVLRFLLISSGMLHETPEGSIRFIHLPFQSFLAARSALSDDSIGLLVRNAHDHDWTDVLALASAQANAEQCEQILEGLLKQRLKQPLHADRITAVAKMCLDYAEQDVPPGLRARIQDAVA